MSATIDLEAALLGPVMAGRECGGCSVCCEVLKIDTPELRKAAGMPCVHRSADGCGIHADRPDVCRAWFCGWRRIAALPDAARPDLSGLVVSLDIMHEPRNCLEGVSIVVRSLTGQAAFESAAAEDMLDLLCDRLVPVWLHDGVHKVLIHPASDVAHFVIMSEMPPAHLHDEVTAWRARYEMFAKPGDSSVGE